MGFSIELPFAQDSKERLLQHFVGLPQDLSNLNPHLSLAVIREEGSHTEALRVIVQGFRNRFGPFEIRLSTLGVFPSKRRPVLTLMPAANNQLLEAHHWISDQMEAVGISPISYYRKYHWTPHVTLVMGRPKREVAEMVEVLSTVRWGGDYLLPMVELIEFHPAVRLEALELRSEG